MPRRRGTLMLPLPMVVGCTCQGALGCPRRPSQGAPRAWQVVVVLGRHRAPLAPNLTTGIDRPWFLPPSYVANIYSNCFRYFRVILQLFHMDVAKVDRDVAYVAMAIHLCCKASVSNVSCDFFRHMLQVFFSGCCICFTHMLQVFYLDVAYVLQWIFQVYSL
jgi:hypothetical protein